MPPVIDMTGFAWNSTTDMLEPIVRNGTLTTTIIHCALRLTAGSICFLSYLVPLHILWRNGEFAGFFMIGSLSIYTFLFTINAAIWPTNDTSYWFNGVGLCDVEVYLNSMASQVFSAAMFALMKNLSRNINQMQNYSIKRERKARFLRQFLIIFPVPIMQQVLYGISSKSRYDIIAMVGCSTTYGTWVYIVAWIPTVIFAIGASFLAGLIYFRFRRFQRTNSPNSNLLNNPLNRQSANRARRRLYLLSITILIPYCPIITGIFLRNVLSNLPITAYSWTLLHQDYRYLGYKVTWGTIRYFAADYYTHQPQIWSWIPLVIVFPVFWFFGMTTETINTYRRILIHLGLARLWPLLTTEYSPNRLQDNRSWVVSFLRSRNGDSSEVTAVNTGVMSDGSGHDGGKGEKGADALGRLSQTPTTLGATEVVEEIEADTVGNKEGNRDIECGHEQIGGDRGREIWDGTQEIIEEGVGEKRVPAVIRGQGNHGVQTNCWSGSTVGSTSGKLRRVTVETEIERRSVRDD